MNKFASDAGKPLLGKALTLVFASRCESSEKACIIGLQDLLGLRDGTALYKEFYAVVDAFMVNPEGMDAFFDEKMPHFGQEVRGMLKSFMASKADAWAEAAALSRPSLPRYVDMDWAIHVRKASAEQSVIGTPAVLMELSVEDQPSLVGQMPKVEKIGLELSREKLETVLDGFYRIRDQLSSVTGGGR